MLDLLRVRRHPLFGEDVAEPLDGLMAKLALLLAESDPLLVEAFQQGPEVVVVLLPLSVDHDVVLDLDHTF